MRGGGGVFHTARLWGESTADDGDALSGTWWVGSWVIFWRRAKNNNQQQQLLQY
jgi:hypothetical protein